MFRRKPPLPTRPTPPTFEAIQEDLNNASEDVVFTLLPDGSNLDAASDGAVASTDGSDGPYDGRRCFSESETFYGNERQDCWPCRSTAEENRAPQDGERRFAQRD
ncbi:hypothetical protein MRX96_037032 [Rhipicephalus microplus]